MKKERRLEVREDKFMLFALSMQIVQTPSSVAEYRMTRGDDYGKTLKSGVLRGTNRDVPALR